MRGEPSSDQERSSKSVPEENARLMALYRRQAKGYDQSGIQGLDTWRREAVSRLALQHGDLVVDIGCGTGLNFALLQEAIGETGRIIGVDLTDAMLEQARQRVAAHGWKQERWTSAANGSSPSSSLLVGTRLVRWETTPVPHHTHPQEERDTEQDN